MILKITYQGQEFTAFTAAEAFGDALTELFQNPNYCLTNDANNQTVAYGVDLLRASIITIAPNVQQPVPDEVKATLEQYGAGRESYDRLIGLASQLIAMVGEDDRYGGMGGAFNPDFERLLELGLISEETFNTVSGAKSVYFNTSEENYDVSARVAQNVVDSCPSAEADLNRAIENLGNQNA
ncbi:MAG: hypothetical protein JWQ09_5989 [Segetibacter sp.]|nr:hypothetical protein [Segetibacter sp.]